MSVKKLSVKKIKAIKGGDSGLCTLTSAKMKAAGGCSTN
jgi:hypothetical protein